MTAPTRHPDLTDLTDAPWAILPPLIPPAKPGGRPRAVDMREVSNTILYLNRTGCQGDLLPHDLRPKSTGSEYFAPWRNGRHLAAHDGRTARRRPPTASALTSPHPQCRQYRQPIGEDDRTGGGAAMMAASTSLAASAMWVSIRWDCGWPSW